MATKRDKRNVLVLAICQALFMTGFGVMFLVGPLVAAPILGDDLTFITLPFSVMLFGLAAATWPAARLMQRIGRKFGFVIGSALGVLGCIIAYFSILNGNLVAFSGGLFLFGIYTGFGQQYRFAAADAAADDFKATAISLVLAAAIVGGFAGPELAKHTRTLFADEFAGTMAGLMGLTLLSGLVILALDIPKISNTEMTDEPRPMRTIARQPAFIAAAAAGALGYVTMNLTMTSAPIAMRLGNGFAFDDAAFVIQWHVIGMFAPGFFTGQLIKRWGAVRVIIIGGVLMLGTTAVAVSGVTLMHFWLSMFAVGVGWNFTFTGATALLIRIHKPSERANVQGVNDLIIFTLLALTSLSSGMLYHFAGWNILVLAAIPVTAIMLVAVIGFTPKSGRQPAA